MDAVTAMTIDKGQKNTKLLVQKLHQPMAVEKQVAVLYCGTHGLLSKVPLEKVTVFEEEFLSTLELTHQEDVLDVIKKGIIDEKVTTLLEKVAEEVARRI